MATAARTRRGFALLAGRAAGWATRATGAGAGQTLPGTVALRLAPDLLAALAEGRRIAVVSATNGKTTTTTMLTAALADTAPALSNSTGSNLARGVLAALMTDRRREYETCVFEVDELALQSVADSVQPQLFVLGNLSRDQLDRMTEVGAVAARWQVTLARAAERARAAGSPLPAVVANADDPIVAAAALTGTAGETALPTIWVSVGQPWRVDSTTCPRCGAAWAIVEDYSCTQCGFRRPTADWRLEGDDLVGPAGLRRTLDLRMPGRSNRANAVLAVAAAAHLGVGVDSALAAIRLLESISGRYARGTVGAVPVRLLLAKNPAGWQEMLEQTASAAGSGTPSPLVLTLNARLADGKDTSWIWDVPFEKLADRVVWAAGERATDLALRLRYAGVQCRYTPEPLAAVAEAAAYAEGRVVDVLANYTAFLGIRDKMGPS